MIKTPFLDLNKVFGALVFNVHFQKGEFDLRILSIQIGTNRKLTITVIWVNFGVWNGRRAENENSQIGSTVLTL